MNDSKITRIIYGMKTIQDNWYAVYSSLYKTNYKIFIKTGKTPEQAETEADKLAKEMLYETMRIIRKSEK